jgi:predicted transcriptional regulator
MSNARLNEEGKIMRWDERYKLLREEMAHDILLMRNNKLTFQQIGDKLGVTRAAVNNFIKHYDYYGKGQYGKRKKG